MIQFVVMKIVDEVCRVGFKLWGSGRYKFLLLNQAELLIFLNEEQQSRNF